MAALDPRPLPELRDLLGRALCAADEPRQGPPDILFQTKEELAAAGYTDEDVTVAQLHYTLLQHLGRVYDLLAVSGAFTEPTEMATREQFGRHAFFESFVRLSGASDVSDELLARRATPGVYDAWDEGRGGDARRDWRREHGDPLDAIRQYRNRLVHGRVVPEVLGWNQDGEQVLFYPRMDKVDDYLDWRLAFPASGISDDFDEAALIVLDAWRRVVEHVELSWRTYLAG